MTLTEFLLARIAEDERVAREEDFSGPIADEWPWDISRALAECETKRRIVESLGSHLRNAERYPDAYPGMVALADWHVRVLATVYADHPDYREDWRP
jgi:hypothetical protein